jgi:aerobic carbon-monoxide dehydrogenase medium subunit
MKPPEFEYHRPDSLAEAIDVLARYGSEATVLAGGQSLMPQLALRRARPKHLVDLQRLGELTTIERAGGLLRIGAMVRHRQLERDGSVPRLMRRAARHIASAEVRNRGTLGGSLAHGDAASDMPAVMLALNATIVAQGDSGSREIAVADFFQDYLETALEPHEVLTEVRFDDARGFGGGYEKFNRRQEDWAMVGVVALVKQEGGVVSDVRVGLTHMATTPLRATAVEEALRGQPLNADTIRAAAEHAADGTNPPEDLNANQDYKRHLARVLTRRALTQAAAG